MTSYVQAQPRVSIGVPVYNGERFLPRALQTLVDQDYDPLEIIVCDNGSTDATEEIARGFARRDRRISYHRSEVNRGAAWNFNRAFGLARGEYFKWAACDDECLPGFLPACVEALDDAPDDVVLCYPKTALIDEESRVVGTFEDDLELRQPRPHQRLAGLLRSNTEYHPVFGVIRADVLRATRLIDTFVASDIALLAELALAGGFVEVPERLFARRFHAGTSMRANPRAEDRAAWFDPAHGARPVLPLTRLTAAFAGSVRRSVLPLGEKWRCLAAIQRHWLLPRLRDVAGELKHAAAAEAQRSLASLTDTSSARSRSQKQVTG